MEFDIAFTYYDESENTVKFILRAQDGSSTIEAKTSLDNASSFAGKVLGIKENMTPNSPKEN